MTDFNKILQSYGVINEGDYARKVSINWTDIPLRKLKKTKIKEDGNYVLISEFGVPPGSPPNILYAGLGEVIEIVEYVRKKGAGYDFDRERAINCHFIDPFTLRIGDSNSFTNLNLKAYTIDMGLNKLIKISNLSHEQVQLALLLIGNQLNFETKVAIGDKWKVANGEILGQIATVKNFSGLGLSNIVEQLVKVDMGIIDYIDIIWMNKMEGNFYCGFEVQITKSRKDFMAAIDYLAVLKDYLKIEYSIYGYQYIPIIVVKKEDVLSLKEISNSILYKDLNVKYLTIEKLVDAYKRAQDIGFQKGYFDLKKYFFHELVN